MFGTQTKRTAETKPGKESDTSSLLFEEEPEAPPKYTEIIDLLLAAGYFRVRISTLSPFDKVVGGLAWSIISSNADLDTDIKFEEGSSIKQQIKIGENIVKALQKLNCPYPLQTHQIRGLDYPSIFPVIQWLVKKVFESREERSAALGKHAEFAFDRKYTLPQDKARHNRGKNAISFISEMRDEYRPMRRYKSKVKPKDEKEHIRTTLLEYGRQSKQAYPSGSEAQPQQREEDSSTKESSGGEGSRPEDTGSKPSSEMQQKKSAIAQVFGGDEKETISAKKEKAKTTEKGEETKETVTEEEKEEEAIEDMIQHLDEIGDDVSKISTSNLGRIVTLRSDDIQKAMSDYEQKAEELENQKQTQEDQAEQMHLRLVSALKRQLSTQSKKLESLKDSREEVLEQVNELQDKLSKLKRYNSRVEQEIEKLEKQQPEDDVDLQKMRRLVALHQNLKEQEREFKANCKRQLEDLNERLDHIRQQEEGEEGQAFAKVKETYEADIQKRQKLQDMLAQLNRDIAMLQRKIDNVPTRTELLQYERRFTELYGQVNQKLQETRKYFDTFNTLTEKCEFLEKEQSLMNSIQKHFGTSSKSKAGKEWLLSTVEQTLEAVVKSKEKTESKLKTELERKESVMESYAKLQAKQRAYYRAVKEFQEEINKNEMLQDRIEQLKNQQG